MSTIAPIGTARRLSFPVVLLAAGALLTGCASTAAPGSSTTAAVTTDPGQVTAHEPSPTESQVPESEELTNMTTNITITMGDTTVRGTLEANATTADLIAQLPLDLSFEDFGGQEKIATLPTALSLDGLPSGSDAPAGTLGYYAPDQGLVLYYESVGYYPGIIPLGTFEGVEAVRDAAPSTGTVSAE
jgi:hypothetical protein